MLSIQDTMKSLNKKYGDNAVSEINNKNIDVDVVKTGCYSLDTIFGCGGIPRGRIIEIAGQESSGKTTLALYLIAQVQKDGGKALFIDAEQSFPSKFAPIIGVDMKKLIFVQPNTGEEALDIAEKMVETGDVDIVVIDSVAALVPEAELAGEIRGQQMALQARMMSKALRLLTAKVSKANTIFIFINQLREKVGIYWGAKTVSAGGKALKYYASVRIAVKVMKKIKGKDDRILGNNLRIKVVKNKVGEPFLETDLDLYFAKGIDIVADVLDTATAKKIITRTGSTYSYKGNKLAVGRDNAKEYLEKNPEVLKQIKGELEGNDVKIEKEAKPENTKEAKNELELDK